MDVLGATCSVLRAPSRESIPDPPWKKFLGVESVGEIPGEDLNRIFISFPGVSFQGPSLH